MRRVVGLVGAGATGKVFARNILAAGHRIRMFDSDPEALRAFHERSNVSICKSPAEAAFEADYVLTCLPDPESTRRCVEGATGVLESASKGAVWIDHSTTDLAILRQSAAAAAQCGVHAVDAPVTGGMALLHRNQMCMYVGSDAPEAILDDLEPLFRLSCSRVVRTGQLGSATVCKVVSNMLAYANTAAMGEALMLASKSGIELEKFYHAMRAGAGNSFVWETEVPLVLVRRRQRRLPGIP